MGAVTKMKTEPTRLVALGNSREEFLESLSRMNIEVGSRKNKNQDQEEKWILKHYFDILIHLDRIKYPIRVEKDESPDFIITESENIYGIEVTQSTSENYQVLLTEHEKAPDTIIEPDKIPYGSSLSRQEILSLLQSPDTPLSGRGWMGLQAEIEAAKWAADAVRKKILKVLSWKTKKTETTKILLYENGPGWINDIDAFQSFLKDKMPKIFLETQADPSYLSVDCLMGNGKQVTFISP